MSAERKPSSAPAAQSGSVGAQRVLVTGASSGIGRAIALACAESGAVIAAAARRVERLDEVVQEIRSRGGQAIAVRMDVSSEESVVAGFDRAQAELGPIDGVVANAGIHKRGTALDMSMAQFDEVLSVNARGVFLTAREGARRMIAAGVPRGRIVLVASIGGIHVLPNVTAYCASKAAVVMMGRSLASEWARHGINVNVICPGYIATEINQGWFDGERGRRFIDALPRKRLIEPSEVGPVTTFLLSSASDVITGAVISVDDAQVA